eukprot:TRINITY_DN1620_c0_g1_i3.p1 TRINITY_DN1620_c0_g1~~TRINITY_DN1620_c0_g1_i3.p1  ORF type:complete len:112 (-),score=20.77 TRINITY_DN1620_c0_g1_i3:161-496(-)
MTDSPGSGLSRALAADTTGDAGEFDPHTLEGSVSGALTLDLEGKIIKSSGDLQDNEDTAQRIHSLLQHTNAFLLVPGRPDPFKRLTVTFAETEFVVTITGDSILVAKHSKA